MRIPSRRSIAPLIRIRQEVDKRIDALLPHRIGARDVAGVLEPAFARGLATATDALRARLAAAAETRFPRKLLVGRDRSTLPARDELLRQADAVARGEWSVFHQAVTVNIDSHDWTRHPLNGVMPPNEHWSRVPYVAGIGGADVKMIWELSRHGQLLRLSQAYFVTRDPSYAETMLRLLDRWLDQNEPGRGINWVSSLEIAFRAIAWCWMWALTCDARAWTRARLERFLVSLWHHARHIERYDSIHHSPNTHLTGEGLGLLYVGLSFPELRGADRWTDLGESILDTELDAQVLADGMHYERATGYHRYTVEFYLHYLILADAFGRQVAPAKREQVRSQVRVTAALRRPDGTWPVVGDEDGGDTLLLGTNDPQDQGPVLALGGAYFGERDWIATSTAGHRAIAWWMLDDGLWDTARITPTATDVSTMTSALPSAGYFVGRDSTGPDGWWCLVDAGPHGGDATGHAHTDLGHVEIARGATRIVCDPGCAAYTTDLPTRHWARSEAAHACLVIDDVPLAEPRGPFSWRTVAPTPASTGGDDGSLWWRELSYERSLPHGRLFHRRQVVLARGWGVVVADWIEGEAGDVALHWPLGGEPQMLTLADGALTGPDYRVMWIGASHAGRLDATLVPMKRSPGYGRQMEGRLLRIQHAGPLPATVVTAFAEPAAGCRVQSRAATTLDLELTGEAGAVPLAIHIAPGKAPSVARHGASELTHGVRS